MLEHDESNDDTSSSMLMSISNINDMIIMSAADLRALYLKQLACDYQKKMQVSLNTKSIIIFDRINHQAWKISILSDAEVINDVDILNKNQHESSKDLSSLDQ
ncbi:uncharacterized protein PADG_12143 [Paracoccidioides brasiliensis Pb18]|uniref:Uncharacterized protein n=1 Tax=Paracoccidioides brasiliensis (strain Pb18) TaxID=502780 RepID=A0A0A0HWQ5_PARBD|nr:uncharacterized protein PADG_12143 [Paracoccidioides brasiliensis Pb18]KGM91825.1 hypothetical protein PADG_12143 [Paracoccidioides brasiliensis Pb18]